MPLDISAFIADIEQARGAGGNIWENACLKNFKSHIKDFYRNELKEQCCYCRKNTHGEFKMVLDIEHILPKSEFGHYMFTVYNLSVSCKRCNMNIKKDDISFVTDLAAAKANGNNSALYQIIHPNLDNYFDHLEYFTATVNQQKIVKYKIIADSVKGKFTYDYFKLNELEIDTINQAQGVIDTEISEKIEPATAKRIEELLKK